MAPLQDIVGRQPRAPMLRKAAQVVMARERGDLQLVDRKLLNFLLQRSLRDLQEKRIHRVQVQDALDYIRHSSTTPLHESLSRLGTVNIEIDYVDEAGVPHSARAHYLSYDMSRTENGYIHFAFDPILLQFLEEPKVFSTINMHFMKQFRSNYAAKLYEVMAMYEKRFNPVWNISVEELKNLLGIAPEQHKRFDNFRRTVIERAVSEVNEIAEFDISVDYVRGGRGGKVVALNFKAHPKMSPGIYTPPELADPLGRGRRYVRDENTVDMLDGMTDSERGTLPVLQYGTRQRALEMLASDGAVEISYDIDVLEDDWQKEMEGRRVRDPDQSFLTWLSLRLERDSDPLLNDFDDDAFGALLERMGD